MLNFFIDQVPLCWSLRPFLWHRDAEFVYWCISSSIILWCRVYHFFVSLIVFVVWFCYGFMNIHWKQWNTSCWSSNIKTSVENRSATYLLWIIPTSSVFLIRGDLPKLLFVVLISVFIFDFVLNRTRSCFILFHVRNFDAQILMHKWCCNYGYADVQGFIDFLKRLCW